MNGVKDVKNCSRDIEEIRRREMKELLKRVAINIIKDREPVKVKGAKDA